jgi:Uma2 family endonuclease
VVVQTRPESVAHVVTHRDLPDTDGEIVQNPYQLPQAMLLSSSIQPVLNRIHGDEPYLMLSDSGIYWRQTKEPLEGCKAPDWFYVPGVAARDEDGPIRSYVLWNHGIRPVIVMEFVSGDGSDEHDQTPGSGKFWVYEQGIGAGYYVIFDTFHDGKLEVYELARTRYLPIRPNRRGHFPIADLAVEIGVWEGNYGKMDGKWLRFFDEDGKMLPSAEEAQEVEQRRADRERERADQERKRAVAAESSLESLREKLRAKGIDPDSL